MRRHLLVSLASAVLAVSLIAYPSVASGGSPFDDILALLRDPDFGLAEIKREVRVIEAAVTATPPAPGPFRLSSGLFGLPAAAQSVDWVVVNDSTTPQTITVTVYEAGVGLKTVAPPGPLTFTLAPGEVTHNANSVSFAGPFRPGFYYEVIVNTASSNVVPTVMVWEAHIATVIAGTTISPGSWVQLQ
jgi:hypothetical protein